MQMATQQTNILYKTLHRKTNLAKDIKQENVKFVESIEEQYF